VSKIKGANVEHDDVREQVAFIMPKE